MGENKHDSIGMKLQKFDVPSDSKIKQLNQILS